MSHAAVSKALHIIGMLVPKLGLAPVFDAAAFAVGLTATDAFWAVSVARSPDPISGERATEKNRST